MGSTPPKVEIEVPLEGGEAGRAPLTERREVIKSASLAKVPCGTDRLPQSGVKDICVHQPFPSAEIRNYG